MYNLNSVFKKVLAILIGIILTLSVLPLASSNAATYYVAKIGSNSYSCNQAQNPSTPKLTIIAGLSCAGPGSGSAGAGHTVEVAAGTYSEALHEVIPGGSSWAAPFTLKAKSGDSVRIKAPVDWNVMWLRWVGYVIIQDLTLDASDSIWQAVRLVCQYNNGTVIPGTCAHHIRFVNTEVLAPKNHCIITEAGADDNEFLGLTVHNCGLSNPSYVPGHNGFYIQGSRNLVENCLVYDTNGGGILGFDENALPSNNVFRNNIVHSLTLPHANGTRTDHIGIGIYKGIGNIAYNNIVYGIHGIGIFVQNECTDCLVYNNTSVNNTGEGYGIYVAAATRTLIKNNITWGNGAGDIYDGGAGTILSNNLCERGGVGCTVRADPKFVNVASHNFRLQAGSPATNAGTNLAPTVISDITGTPRPQGSGYDIGAYEFTVNPPPAPVLRVE